MAFGCMKLWLHLHAAQPKPPLPLMPPPHLQTSRSHPLRKVEQPAPFIHCAQSEELIFQAMHHSFGSKAHLLVVLTNQVVSIKQAWMTDVALCDRHRKTEANITLVGWGEYVLGNLEMRDLKGQGRINDLRTTQGKGDFKHVPTRRSRREVCK